MEKIKRKVLFITNIPSPYRVDFFNELGAHCALTVLFEREKSEDREVNWHNYNFNNFEGIFLKGVKKGANTAFSPMVIKYLKKNLFDCIIVGGYATPTGMLAINYLKFNKIPYILNSDGGMINKKEGKLKWALKKFFISSAAGWLSTGKVTTNYLKYYGADPNRIFVYPFTTLSNKDMLKNPISFKEKRKIKKQLNIKEEKVILSIGQFIPRKGIDVLLKASKNLPDNIGIYIIGGDPTKEYLELIKNLSLTNIHFVKFQSKINLSNFFLASDLFVLPTREDIWGLVINEAMAYGLPVVTTDKCVAGTELISNNKNGLIIAADNHDQLNKAIVECLKDEKELLEMSKNSLKTIKEYSIENMAATTIEIIEEFAVKGNEK